MRGWNLRLGIAAAGRRADRGAGARRSKAVLKAGRRTSRMLPRWIWPSPASGGGGGSSPSSQHHERCFYAGRHFGVDVVIFDRRVNAVIQRRCPTRVLFGRTPTSHSRWRWRCGGSKGNGGGGNGAGGSQSGGEHAVPRSGGSSGGSTHASGGTTRSGGTATTRSAPPANANGAPASNADRAVPSWSRPRGDRPSTGVAVPRTGHPNNGVVIVGGGYYNPFFPYGFGYPGYSLGLGFGFADPWYDPFMYSGYGYGYGYGGYGGGGYGEPAATERGLSGRLLCVHVRCAGSASDGRTGRLHSPEGQAAGREGLHRRVLRWRRRQFDGAFQKLSVNGGHHESRSRPTATRRQCSTC